MKYLIWIAALLYILIHVWQKNQGIGELAEECRKRGGILVETMGKPDCVPYLWKPGNE